MKPFHQFSVCNILSFLLLLVVHISNGDPAKPSETKSALPPIILMPGSMATKLYVEGKNSEELKHVCDNQENQEYKKTWISMGLIDQKLQKCLFAQLTLDNDGRQSVNKHPELVVDTLNKKEFGSFSAVNCLLLDQNDKSCQESIDANNAEANFGPLVKWLTKTSGLNYEEGENLFAAPYDWRYEANNPHLDTFYDQLTHLIETSTKKTGQRALLILHSLGNNVGNYYLTRKKNGKWQKTHIAATINVAAPFGGTVEVLEEILSGNSKRYFSTLAKYISDQTVLPFARSLGFIATVLPNEMAFQNHQKLIYLNKKWNTMKDIKELLTLANAPHFYQIYQDTIPKPQEHTKMHCIYGILEKQTPLSYTYGVKGISQPPIQTKYGSGDDTVNAESLRVCKKWKKKHPNATIGHIVELKGVNHAGIISNAEFYEFVRKIAVEIQNSD